MLTDLRLRKYLRGLLSEEDTKEVEAWIEKNPEVKARLETLKSHQGESVGKPMWQRLHLGKKNRSGARTRTTILLPLLLAIGIILMLSEHWFSRPGANSTFTMTGGNGTALELLYNGAGGWRYLDASFREGDSLTFAVRDSNLYHVAILAVFGRGAEAEVQTLWNGGGERRFGKQESKPVFPSRVKGRGRPRDIVVFYDDTPLPELPATRVLDILETKGNERGGLDIQYQVFSSGL